MRQRLEQTARRLGTGADMRCRMERNRMDMSGRLDMLELRVRKGDPVAMLRPGSAYVLRDNRPVESAADLGPGDRLDLLLRDGTARCLVEDIRQQK